MKTMIFFVILVFATLVHAEPRFGNARIVNVGSNYQSYVCGVEDLSDEGECSYPQTVERVLRITTEEGGDCVYNSRYDDCYSFAAPIVKAYDFPASEFTEEQIAVLTATNYQAKLQLFNLLFSIENKTVRLK